jgi:cbb3-type cytochrome oxidase maturation protein
MEVIYGLIPGMIILGLIAVAVLFWAAKSGQFEDLEGEASRILMDDDLPVKAGDQEGAVKTEAEETETTENDPKPSKK